MEGYFRGKAWEQNNNLLVCLEEQKNSPSTSYDLTLLVEIK